MLARTRGGSSTVTSAKHYCVVQVQILPTHWHSVLRGYAGGGAGGWHPAASRAFLMLSTRMMSGVLRFAAFARRNRSLMSSAQNGIRLFVCAGAWTWAGA